MRAHLTGLLLAAAGSAAPAAATPQVRVADPCVWSGGEFSEVSATGFAPGAALELLADGEVLAYPEADSTGGFAGWALRIGDVVGGSDEVPGVVVVDVEAREQADPLRRAIVPQRMAAVAVSATPSRGPAGTVVRWRATGLASSVAAGGHGRTVYAHWLRDGRFVATTRFGRMRGPCGNLRRRHPLLPAEIARPGTWEVRLVNRRAFDIRRGGYASTTITVSPDRG